MAPVTQRNLSQEFQGLVEQWEQIAATTPGDKRAFDIVDILRALESAYFDAELQHWTAEQNTQAHQANASLLESFVRRARIFLVKRGLGKQDRPRDADFLHKCTQRDLDAGLHEYVCAERFIQVLRGMPRVCAETRVPHRDAPYEEDQSERDVRAVEDAFLKHTVKEKPDVEAVVKGALRAVGHRSADGFFAYRHRRQE